MAKMFEEQRLAAVRAAILREMNTLAAALTRKRGDVTGARQDMWAETHVIRDFDDVANLATLLSDVTLREKQYEDARRRLNHLKRMIESPYFGRIDFTEDGFDEVENIYIGGQSLFDEAKQQFWIYDWRAPISSMYYDFGVGRASFTAPDGPVNGEITLKRQYRIEKGELIYAFDSDLKIDDDILQQELSKASDAKIKTIINTIQREQNQAIRAEATNLLVVGPAGSGKTSVGLHRLAYLLYRHRGKLTSARVRIFSSNPIFNTYIAGIIPELGEEDVVTLDFKTLLSQYGTRTRDFYDAYEQMDYLSGGAPVAGAGHAISGRSGFAEPAPGLRRAAIAMKYHPDFAAFVAGYIRQYAPAIDEDVYFNTDLLCEKKRLADLYSDRTTAGNLASKTARVMDYVNRSFETYFKENKKSITEFFNDLYEENLLDDEVRQKFDEQRNIVLADLRNRLYPDTQRMYEKIIRAYIREKGLDPQIGRFTAQALHREKCLYEDVLVMFYIDTLTGRVRKERSVRHILVDEAQDIGHMQHLILQNIFEGCHFTILADVKQALFPDININDPKTLQTLYKDAPVITLSKSYRSTYEISRFAAQILGEFDETLYYKRLGGEPDVIKAKNAAQAAAEWLDAHAESGKSEGCMTGVSDLGVCDLGVSEPVDSDPEACDSGRSHSESGKLETFNTVGILLSTQQKATDFCRAFVKHIKHAKHEESTVGTARLGSIRLIGDADDSFQAGVMVMAVPYAKGLEFDAVIIPEYGQPVFESAQGKRMLYLMCTRALHRLCLVETE